MGVPEDINWLKENRKRFRIFAAIATKKASKIRELKDRLSIEDWWPVKLYVKELVDRGLIVEVDGSCRLTEGGQKVLESLLAVRELETI
ncbi:MAG: winged helix-turn-helix domain-containing protein [Hadesarchaea archaeon]|nr:winged helix-turn-helix domain-containing protein [Hadesarchaea archaeon]